MAKSDDVSEWLGEFHVSTSEINWIVMDYLITEGYKDAAEKFREEAGLEGYPDKDWWKNLDERIQIRGAINCGRISDAIQRINDLHPHLLDDDRFLHFRLLQQELIELIRDGKVEEALKFAQERLAEKGEENPKVLEELERTLALLAFEKPDKSPFAHLLHHSHRQTVACEVNSALLECEGRRSRPQLETLLQMVHWAQDLFDHKKIDHLKMVDFGRASFQDSKKSSYSSEDDQK